MKALAALSAAAVLLTACGTQTATTETSAPATPVASDTTTASPTPLATSQTPTPTPTSATPGPVPDPDIDTDAGREMLQMIIDIVEPLQAIQDNTDNFSNDYGCKIAQPKVIVPAVQEIQPRLIDGMRLNTGNPDVDKSWDSIVEQLDTAMTNLDKAFKPGNKYQESDCLLGLFGLYMVSGELEPFINDVGTRIN
jgi:hypothetical protein